MSRVGNSPLPARAPRRHPSLDVRGADPRAVGQRRGFALMLWTGPVWTPARLLLALVWTRYCVLGPLHKEQRYSKIYAEKFAAHQREVPYMLPGRRGAP